MADKIEVYEVVNTSPLFKTVLDYILDQDSPAFQYKDNPDSFLLVKNKSGITNREAIEGMYHSKYEKSFAGKTAKELLIKIGTPLAIEKQKANMAGLLTEGLEVVSYDVNAFKARALAELESKEGYSVVDVLKPIQGKLQKGVTKEMYPDMSVWVWCRSLAANSNNYEGEIFNLTPFIERIETNVTKNGGNWQMSLPPLVCEKTADGKWSIRKKSIQFYNYKKRSSLQPDGYVASDNLNQLDESGAPIRNSFLFHTILNTNDIVFIRFETLKMEATQRQNDASFLFVPKQQLPDRIYDMIGLIDRNGITVQPSDTDVSINVSGRDLSKLFIDDGAYFFALEMSQGMLGGPGSANSVSGGLTQRLSYDNGLQYLSLYFNNTIDKIFKFIINQLSNIKVAPSSLFSAYGNKRNSRFEENKDGDQNVRADELQALKERALQAILKLRELNGLTFQQPTNEKAAVERLFNEQKRFQEAIRTQGARQVGSNNTTVGWTAFQYTNERGVIEPIVEDAFSQFLIQNLYNVSVTRTVPEAIPIVELIDQTIDIEESTPTFKKGLEKRIAPGIWQIIKLVVDSVVLKRRVVDSSISAANGSLMNFFRKVCQEPFVEYYGDTYGDTYNLVIRKPPIDRKGIMSMLSAQVETEELVSSEVTDEGQLLRFTETKVTPLIVDILPEDVLTEDLSFDDSEAYSWYHLMPQSVFQGSASHFSLAYLPAVFFEEYAEIWGSKPYQISHNYMPMIPRDADQKELSIIEEQAVEDMRFIIESNAYLPFTRKGVLKLNGDRRLKVGNLIRYKPTGEIFMIDGVQQSFGIGEAEIDRTTTLQVSRGMVEQLIYGVPIADNITGKVVSYASYFNIINTRPNYEYKTVTNYVTQKLKTGEDNLSTTLKESLAVVESNVTSSRILSKTNQNTYLIESYAPEVKARFIQLINAINLRGYSVIITSTKRSGAEQLALYNAQKNNTVLKAAAPGSSPHEKGLAMDLNLVAANGQIITSKANQVAWLSTGIPQLAKILGFKWGGDSFRDNYDPVHFEVLTVVTQNREEIAQSIYEESKHAVPSKVLDTTKIFSNFKVNREVFNFFLRHDQFDKKYLVSNNTFIDTDQQGNVTSSLEPVTVTSKKSNG